MPVHFRLQLRGTRMISRGLPGRRLETRAQCRNVFALAVPFLLEGADSVLQGANLLAQLTNCRLRPIVVDPQALNHPPRAPPAPTRAFSEVSLMPCALGRSRRARVFPCLKTVARPVRSGLTAFRDQVCGFFLIVRYFRAWSSPAGAALPGVLPAPHWPPQPQTILGPADRQALLAHAFATGRVPTPEQAPRGRPGPVLRWFIGNRRSSSKFYNPNWTGTASLVLDVLGRVCCGVIGLKGNSFDTQQQSRPQDDVKNRIPRHQREHQNTGDAPIAPSAESLCKQCAGIKTDEAMPST